MANWIPEVWADELLGAIQFKTMLADAFDRRYERNLKFGDTLNIARGSNPTTNTKAEDTEVTFEAITEGVQQITVTVHQYNAMRIEDRAEVQSKYAIRSFYTERMGYAMARAMDVQCATLMQNYSQIYGTLGSELTDDNVQDSRTDLVQAEAPEPWYLWISPRAMQGLMKIDSYRNEAYGGQGAQWLKEGVPLRRVAGATVLESNLTRAPSAGQSESAMFSKQQNALVVQINPTTILLHNPSNIEWQVVMHQLYGTAEINRPPETPGGGTAVDTWAVLLRTLQ
jgi:hypothetical protein